MTPHEIRSLHLLAQSKMNREVRRGDQDSRILLGHVALVGELGEALNRCCREAAASVEICNAKSKTPSSRDLPLAREVNVSVRCLQSIDDEEYALLDESSLSDENNDDDCVVEYEADEFEMECALLRTTSYHLQYQDFIEGLSYQRRTSSSTCVLQRVSAKDRSVW